jgi:dynactin 5
VCQALIESGVVIRGDLAKVRIGKYTLILENTAIRPAYKLLTGGLNFFPTQIGSHTRIGKNCVIEALKVGSFVHVGDNCIIVRSSVSLTLVQRLKRCFFCRASDAS